MASPSSPAPPSRRERCRSFVNFLGSVQFATVLLLIGIAAMAAGTVLESHQGALVAQSLVYRSAWFTAFLVLIALNLVMAVIKRLPLRKTQLSFAVTHFGILLLLVGAWVSHSFGYEGKLYVREGEESHEILMNGLDLVVERPSADPTAPPLRHSVALPDRSSLDGFRIPPERSGDLDIEILRFLYDGFLDHQLVPSPQDGPGLCFRIDGKEGEFRDFLLAGDPDRRQIDTGPFHVQFLSFTKPEDLASATRALPPGSQVILTPAAGSDPISVPLPEDLGKTIDCGDGLSITVENFYLHARIGDEGLRDDPSAPLNPAAVVTLRRGDREETRTLFSQFPDFNTRSSKGADPLAAEIHLEDASSSSPLITLLRGPAPDSLFLRVTDGDGRHAAQRLEVGETTQLPGLPYQLTVETLEDHARLLLQGRAANEGETGGHPVAKFLLRHGDDEVQTWLELGSSTGLLLDGHAFHLALRQRRHPLPFVVRLEDFELDYHPGSGRPSAFTSRIVLASRDHNRPAHGAEISMNEPLDFAGFRIFQSGYVLGRNGAPDTSILSVARDPGAPIVYLAFVILIFGVAWYLLGDGRHHHHEHDSRSGSGYLPSKSRSSAPPNPDLAAVEETAADGSPPYATIP